MVRHLLDPTFCLDFDFVRHGVGLDGAYFFHWAQSPPACSVVRTSSPYAHESVDWTQNPRWQRQSYPPSRRQYTESCGQLSPFPESGFLTARADSRQSAAARLRRKDLRARPPLVEHDQSRHCCADVAPPRRARWQS